MSSFTHNPASLPSSKKTGCSLHVGNVIRSISTYMHERGHYQGRVYLLIYKEISISKKRATTSATVVAVAVAVAVAAETRAKESWRQGFPERNRVAMA